MKSIKSLYIILFFLSINLFYSQTALAQRSNIIKELPYSSDEYFTQLSIHFDRVQDKKKKIVKKFLKDLEEKWTTGFFSDDIKEKIYETSNLMLQNKMRAMPFFYDYLNTLELLIESDLPEDTKNSWMKSLDLVLKTQKNSVFTEYLDNSNKLFNENYIFNNRIITWKVTGNWSM